MVPRAARHDMACTDSLAQQSSSSILQASRQASTVQQHECVWPSWQMQAGGKAPLACSLSVKCRASSRPTPGFTPVPRPALFACRVSIGTQHRAESRPQPAPKASVTWVGATCASRRQRVANR